MNITITEQTYPVKYDLELSSIGIKISRMPSFIESLNSLLEEVSSSVKISKEKLLLKAEVSPKQWRDYLKAKRAPSLTMLEGLASVQELGLSYEELRAKRIMEELGPVSQPQAKALLQAMCEALNVTQSEFFTLAQEMERQKKGDGNDGR